jgi:hypothetical protein
MWTVSCPRLRRFACAFFGKESPTTSFQVRTCSLSVRMAEASPGTYPLET